MLKICDLKLNCKHRKIVCCKSDDEKFPGKALELIFKVEDNHKSFSQTHSPHSLDNKQI